MIKLPKLRQFLPKNSGMANVARSGLNQLRGVAVQQSINSLSVDGLPILLYKQLKTGIRCTCSQTPSKLDASGNATPEHLATLLEGTDFSIKRYGSRNAPPASGNPRDNIQRSEPHPLERSNNFWLQSGDMDDPFAKTITQTPIHIQAPGSGIATSSMGCNVCLGTGWVGGYNPINSFRSVYDSQCKWEGVYSIERNALDFIKVQANTWLSLAIAIPTGTISTESFRVWKNKELLANYVFLIDGKAVSPLDLPALVGNHTLQLKFPEETLFSHIELQLEQSIVPIYAEWGKVGISENLQYPENMDSPTVTISPNAPSIQIYDVIGEPLYRKLWVVTNTNPTFDRERQVTGWEATVRMLQPWELEFNLPKQKSRISFGGTSIATTPKNAPQLNPY